MTRYRVAIVGTGGEPEDPTARGFSMGYKNAASFTKVDGCELVACADVVPENARAFSSRFGIEEGSVYQDHRDLLHDVRPDIVCVCTPPEFHADIVVDCARTDSVRAVHCEKPMATTWGDCLHMVDACDRHGVQLTFNHQRRFGEPWRQAKRLLDSGVIGDLTRIEFAAMDLFDYGSHSFDLCNYLNDERAAKWIIAQISDPVDDLWDGNYAHHNETHSFALWEYENGVYGMASTGAVVGPGAIDCHNRLVGTDGVIEVGPGWYLPQSKGGTRENAIDGAALRVRKSGWPEWEHHDCDGEGIHELEYLDRAVADAVGTLDENRVSQLNGTNALNATGLIFGCWESARQRGRIDFPLGIDDNPLEAMIENGALDAGSVRDRTT